MDAPNVAILLENNNPVPAVEDHHVPLVEIVPPEEPVKRRPKLERMSSIEEIEMASCRLEPHVEGRIVVIGPDTLPGLMDERYRWERSVTPTIPEGAEN